MSSLNKVCAAFAVAVILLAAAVPYAVDAAFGTHVVQTFNKVK